MTNLFLDTIRYRKIIQISHSASCFVHQCFGASQHNVMIINTAENMNRYDIVAINHNTIVL